VKYPYIRVSTHEEYPTITIVDSTDTDGCKYYGGFYDTYDAKDWIESLGGIWQTPSCLKSSFIQESRPCLNHHMGKCLAPCGRKIGAEQYKERLSEMMQCLDGDCASTMQRLENEMTVAADKKEIKKAAKLRDQTLLLKRLRKRQKSFCTQQSGRQVYLYFRAYNEKRYSLFYINDGHTLDRLDFESIEMPPKKRLEQFIKASKKKTDYTDDSKRLTECLLDIRADKYFLVIKDESETEQTVCDLLKAHKDFMNGEDS
jgi:excinuclease ABC subunit C